MSKSHNSRPAISLDTARTPPRSGTPKRSAKRVSGSPNIYEVKGCISDEWLELRVLASNKDEACARAHLRGMRIAECIEVKRHTYPLNGIGFGKGRTRDTV